jgi:hypothetical protein
LVHHGIVGVDVVLVVDGDGDGDVVQPFFAQVAALAVVHIHIHIHIHILIDELKNGHRGQSMPYDRPNVRDGGW